MKVLLDANLPRSAAQVVRDAGHVPTDVRDIGLGGAPDDTIAALAKANGMCLVTGDFDFADVRNYPPADYQGLIVLDLPENAVARQVCELLAAFLARPDLDAVMPGRLAIVRVDRVRFRPALIP
ncbi:MAG: DUF5615 family PIN-like protein [Phycisphaerae bacterium]|nr:DUF5615 family PIN-like protein [Tepidisphaeraceae bacterium]